MGTTMTTEFDAEEVAYGIVYDYLVDGPEYLDVANATQDNGGSVDEVEKVYDLVQATLRELRGSL